MGSKGGSTNSSSSGYSSGTSSTTLPDWVTNAAQGALTYGEQLAGRAYTPYTGQLVADVSPYTTQAYQGIEALQGQANPYYNASLSTYGGLLGSATPITSGQIAGDTNTLYGNYAQQVVDPSASLYSGALGQNAGILGNAYAQSQGQFNNALDYSSGQFGNAMGQSQGYFGQALGNTGNLMSNYLANAAPATASQVASNIGTLMNPYMSYVVSPTETLMQQQLAQNLASNAAQANNVGAFGGSRMGVQNAVAQAQEPVLAGQQLGNMLYQGYNAAMQPAYGLATTASQQGYNAGALLAGQGMTAAQQLAQQGYGSAANLAQQAYGGAGQMAQQGYNTAALEAQQNYNAANALSNLMGTGYSNAQQNAYGLAGQNLSAGLTAAQQMPSTATAMQNQAATEAGLLQSAGTADQQQQQNILDSLYSQFQEAQYYPYQQLDTLLGTLGSIPYSTTTDYSGYNLNTGQTSTTPSWGSQASSALGLLGTGALLIT